MSDYYYDDQTEANSWEQPSQSDSGFYRYVPAHPAEQSSKKLKKKKTGFIATALCFSLLGSALGAGGVLLVSRMTQQEAVPADTENISVMLQGQRETSTIEIVQMDTSQLLTAAQVYAANVNSTVGITTAVTTNYWGFQTTSAASGSGFIISDDGYILTNYHVIEDAESITVSMYNGDSFDASLIGYDESNDIAVLKVEGENLTPVVLGDSDTLNVGDDVVAIGNPLGELTFSLTAGTISAKDREVTLSSSVTMNLLQTDCAINSGNSGGALFNMYGEVIGITNAKYSSSSSSEASIDNIGFAIPINSVMDIVESIIEKGYISKPYIGVTVSDVSTQTQLYGVPAGAAVQSVTDQSPAAQAGLQAGDVITQVNGVQITGSSELVNTIGSLSVGDILALTVYRQGEILEVTVTVGEQIQSAMANETDRTQQSQQNVQGNFPWGNSGSFGGRP